jgi:hypothetical protein
MRQNRRGHTDSLGKKPTPLLLHRESSAVFLLTRVKGVGRDGQTRTNTSRVLTFKSRFVLISVILGGGEGGGGRVRQVSAINSHSARQQWHVQILIKYRLMHYTQTVFFKRE